MKKKWDIATLLEVIELEKGLGQFKVVNSKIQDNDVAHNNGNNVIPLTMTTLFFPWDPVD
jgi:hypothetical protein